MVNSLSFQLVLTGVLLFLVVASLIVYLFVIQRMKINRQYLERQQLLLQVENKELAVCFEERELTMTQVSKEVHDHIGQLSHLSRMHLHEIEAHATDPYQLQLIKYVSGLLDQIISNTNHIGHSLNSDFIKKRGLARVLEDDLEQIKASTAIACYMHVEGKRNLEPEKQLLVYRIAQEAIHNTLKHAAASLLEIDLVYTESHFKMRVHDNGKGFDIEQVKEKGTMGLLNMEQRANLLKGKLAIDTASGNGCIINLEVPI